MNQQQCISYIDNPKKDSDKYKRCLKMVIQQYATFVGSAQNYDNKHFMTRRLESLAGLMILFGVLVVVLNIRVLKGEENINIEPLIWLDALNFVAMSFLWMRVISLPKLPSLKKSKTWQELEASIKSNKGMVNGANQDITLMVSIWAVVLLCYLLFINSHDYLQVAVHSLVWGVMLFGGAYSANRKYGYTRAFMRNGFYAVKVEVLYYQLIGNQECIDTIWGKLGEMAIDAKAQAYKDTVNDYIEVNNSISKWLSSKKIK